MITASDELSIADTNRDDMAFLSYTSGTTEIQKQLFIHMAWAYAHLRTAGPHWLCINEGDTVWATAGPGWMKWIWSPFLSCTWFGCNRHILSWEI